MPQPSLKQNPPRSTSGARRRHSRPSETLTVATVVLKHCPMRAACFAATRIGAK